MSGEISAGALEAIGTAPASMEITLGGGPMLDVLSFAGLAIALLAAALLLLLNREDRTSTA